jgi:hypothetical protein
MQELENMGIGNRMNFIGLHMHMQNRGLKNRGNFPEIAFGGAKENHILGQGLHQ